MCKVSGLVVDVHSLKYYLCTILFVPDENTVEIGVIFGFFSMSDGYTSCASM